MSHHRNPSLPVPAVASVPAGSTSVAYPPDDGPLDAKQLELIRQLVAMPAHPTVRSTLLAVSLSVETEAGVASENGQ